MFHIKNSEVYLTSSNAEGMSDNGNVAPLLGSEEPVVTPFSLYFNNLSSDNTRVSSSPIYISHFYFQIRTNNYFVLFRDQK